MIEIAKKNVKLWRIIDADHIICIESTPDVTIRLRDRIYVYISRDEVDDIVIRQSEPSEFYPRKEKEWYKCLVSAIEHLKMSKR